MTNQHIIASLLTQRAVLPISSHN